MKKNRIKRIMYDGGNIDEIRKFLEEVNKLPHSGGDFSIGFGDKPFDERDPVPLVIFHGQDEGTSLEKNDILSFERGELYILIG